MQRRVLPHHPKERFRASVRGCIFNAAPGECQPMAQRPRLITQSRTRSIARAPFVLAVFFFATSLNCRAQTTVPSAQTALSEQQSPQQQSPQRQSNDQQSAPPDTPYEQLPAPAAPPDPPPIQEQAVQNPFAPCIQPPPPVGFDDYKGPFAKTIAIYAQRLERKSVGQPGSSPHYKPGALLCTLAVKDKFWLFVSDSTDPVAFVNASFDAGLDQVQNNQRSWGRGFTGYLDRFGANMASQTSSNFFKDFFYPTIFSEDPRYYRLGRGTNKRRIIHAMSHVAVAHNVNGNSMFNFSYWLGGVTVVALSNTYLPDNKRGVEPVAVNLGFGMVQDMGYDILREYWPEIAHKFRLPFRDQDRGTTTITQSEAATPH
jgi:hypothetical protein